MNFLEQAAYLMLAQAPNISRMMVQKLPKQDRFCKCGSIHVAGHNTKVTVRKRKVLLKCLICNRSRNAAQQDTKPDSTNINSHPTNTNPNPTNTIINPKPKSTKSTKRDTLLSMLKQPTTFDMSDFVSK
jgi:hypothetical protein